jgi:hypothetical protein
VVKPRVTGSFGVMFIMFQCDLSRSAVIVLTVVPMR